MLWKSMNQGQPLWFKKWCNTVFMVLVGAVVLITKQLLCGRLYRVKIETPFFVFSLCFWRHALLSLSLITRQVGPTIVIKYVIKQVIILKNTWKLCSEWIYPSATVSAGNVLINLQNKILGNIEICLPKEGFKWTLHTCRSSWRELCTSALGNCML